jgi:gliding motility-associated-like protein
MKLIKIILLYTFVCCYSYGTTAQSITVDDSKNEVDLVSILTDNGNCVGVSGRKVKGDTFPGSTNSYGSFSAGTSSFPFSGGVLLSTWSSKNAEGPFVRSEGGGDSSWLGDIDLDQELGIKSINASVLEFDFVPVTNFISFDYIFASNEYQDVFPCNYSDGFAFLIKENDGSANYKNLAVLPNTVTPVSSMNVRPFILEMSGASQGTQSGCDALNEQYFGQSNSATTNSAINYSGQTIVLTAQTNVIEGKSYHIKLVIADDGLNTGDPNVLYDSAVFIKAGSFVSKINLGQDKLIATNNPVCFGETITLSSSLTGPHKWTRTDSSGTTTLPEMCSSLTVQKEGVYKVEVPVAGTCTVSGEIKIEYTSQIILKNTELIKCDDNEDPSFDLTETETIIRNGDSSLTTFEYYETQAGTVLSNPIANPTSFVKTAPTDQTVFVKVTSATYGCNETAEINLQTIDSYELITTPSTKPIVNDFSGNNNSVQLIPPADNDTYEFSLDGKKYQLSPFFTNLAVGNYTAFIRNADTCAYLTYSISILDYPRFFTPNGDGYNDSWNIKNLELLPKSIITIYDRYGKLLKQFNPVFFGWNGSFNGSLLPSDDYWFSLKFEDGKIIKGHFTLKR